MDTLSEVLENLRSSGALIGKNLLTPPWAIRLETGSALTVATMLRGKGWLHRDGHAPLRMEQRDLVVLSGPGTGLITDDAAADVAPTRTAPTCTVSASGVCTDPRGAAWEETTDLGDAVAGQCLDADHVLLNGTFRTHGRIADRLLESLPPVIVVPRAQQRSRAPELLEEELENTELGRQAVLDKLLDLVLIGALRDWVRLPDAAAPAWYKATTDPVVGAAIAAIHADPARAWTVDALARISAVSRASFARRFAEMMGEPPISYLAAWRLCLAADLIEGTADTLESIARRVGYSSAHALSAAFTREFAMRPSHYRSQSRSGESQAAEPLVSA